MAAAPPVEPFDPATTRRLPAHRRARIIALCALLAVIAVVTGLIASSARRDPAPATATVISDSAIVATALPNAPTPTPLANKPTPTPPLAPTATALPTMAIPPTGPPPVAAPPAAQPVPAQVAPGTPHGNGDENGDGSGKGKGKEGKGKD
jgi:hypothetical protein